MKYSGHTFGEDYFYIQSPEDFERFLKPMKVSNNECRIVDGPLLQLLKSKKPGTLLINWSNFSEKQIATYKSILEKKAPKLQGHIVPPELKIINVTQPETKACSSFRTRTQKVAWPKKLEEVPKTLPIIFDEAANDSFIDLHESESWETSLVGRIKIIPDGFMYEPGVLINAIKSGKNAIYLTGLISTPKLNIFLEKLQRERKFYANNEWYTLPENFTIHIASPAHDDTPLPVLNREANPNATIYYLNKQNYAGLFEQFTVNEEKQALQHAGWMSGLHDHAILALTDELAPGEIRRLKKSLKPDIQLVQLDENKAETLDFTEETRFNLSSIILTSDPDAAQRQLAEKPEHSITISETTQFSHLFENVTLERKEEKSQVSLRFEHEYFQLYDSLKKGKTVVLKGPISNELYHQLETLFAAPPYLILNGQREEIPGKLILITSPKEDFPKLFNSARQHYKHSLSWEKTIPLRLQSELNFSADEAKKTAAKIKKFYQDAGDIRHNGKTTPPKLLITEENILNIARAMKKHPHKNPIEHGFLENYRENKSAYEELNALAEKYLYKPAEEKEDINLPLEEKQKNLIHEILEDSSFVELRGAPGTGKTHFLEHMISENDAFWGEKDILKWLGPGTPGSKKYLLLDEANMKKPGYWDFLKDLKTGTICYKGKFYPVDPAIHKVIFTGNPENYPQRYYHTFLQQIPKVHFPSHTDDYLNKFIIKQMGPQIDPKTKSEIARLFIAVYKHIKQELPYEIISMRDIKTLVGNFLYPDLPNQAEAMPRAHLACQKTFTGLFNNPLNRKNYFDYLQTNFNCPSEALKDFPRTKDPEYYLPNSKKFLWNKINESIEKGGLLPDSGARRGVLVEGVSGMGKSEMMLQAVHNQDFVHESQYDENGPKGKIYFHLSMGSNNVADELLRARKLSKKHQVVIIADELNLLKPKDEMILTALLEGRSPEKEKYKIKPKKSVRKENKCNLVVLASQNSQAEGGRAPLSYPILNRLDTYYEEALTRDDLLEICSQSGKFSDDINHPRTQRFVDQFMQQHQQHPTEINTRNFFEELKKLPFINMTYQQQHRLHKPAKNDSVMEKKSIS
ncbi:MAG TPA: hypothetical protein VLG50_01635, partial [Candidatus Saccharimonadales bacterium]|nr:hypothetical protein [Candidatus Saccharimonadales bacterium]